MSLRNTRRPALIAAGVLALASTTVSAQVASSFLKVGDTLPGTGDAIVDIKWATTNSVGGWIFGFETMAAGSTAEIDRIWGTPTGGTPTLLLTEGTYDGAAQAAFETRRGFFPRGT